MIIISWLIMAHHPHVPSFPCVHSNTQQHCQCLVVSPQTGVIAPKCDAIITIARTMGNRSTGVDGDDDDDDDNGDLDAVNMVGDASFSSIHPLFRRGGHHLRSHVQPQHR